ncbi:MAG: helix-turn-helix transcriptional regulator [Streptomyces sp.]|uniref:winged helix-turn-helix transcriptional regulator n=1 Tax=Streptomyces sp. TaxID=1931 RepID=UPI0025F09331|nr:helix-turn-helix domain-containing protein [Streptomyces sp.]MBW8801552.1 helix-turn-helix transcriptional regulator [Streptomyces sp.]
MDTAGRAKAAAAGGPCARIPAEQMDFVRQILDRVGDKWSMLVISVLEAGPLRYTELQRAVPGISQRMLSLTMSRLQQDGLVTRTAYAEVPPRVEYALTPLGGSLHHVVTSLITWVAEHHAQIREHRSPTTTTP